MVPLWAQPKLRPLPRHCTQQVSLSSISREDCNLYSRGAHLNDNLDHCTKDFLSFLCKTQCLINDDGIHMLWFNLYTKGSLLLRDACFAGHVYMYGELKYGEMKHQMKRE